MDLVTSAIEPIRLIAETVYGLFMKEKNNKDQCLRLAKSVDAIMQTLDVLRRQKDLDVHSAELQARLREVKGTLEAAEALLLKREGANQLKKLLKAHKTSDKLDDLFQQLSDDHTRLTLLLQVEGREKAGATIRKVDVVQDTLDRTDAKVTAVHDQVDSALQKVHRVDEKMDDSQKQMGALHDKVAESQQTMESLNQKMEKLIKAASLDASGGDQTNPNPGPPSGVPTNPNPGPPSGVPTNPNPGPPSGVPTNPNPGLPSGVPTNPNPGAAARPAGPPIPEDAVAALSAVRSRFVEKASLPLLKQLLDELQTERVLNEEEAESVLEEQAARADRARCLIDIVRKKGRRASERMIAHLREKDSSLAETLGLV
ncbi:arp2/3 complex-activating protein rickA-like [Sardina pilchardus]|uniref:arp2/3 complex-activating protein rickA-like n=1 Tax=Sardina pilchardus TaxID=27697 RepID=UPI002E11F6B7